MSEKQKMAMGLVACTCGVSVSITEPVYYPDEELSRQAAHRVALRKAVAKAEQEGWDCPNHKDFTAGKPDRCPECRKKQ